MHRCVLSTDCVPEADNVGFSPLPLSSNDAVTIEGRCVPPCGECETMATNPQCGQDGKTYRNSCYLTCAQIPVSVYASSQLGYAIVWINLVHLSSCPSL